MPGNFDNFKKVRDKVKATPLRRNVHPSIECGDCIVPKAAALPKPPGNELAWRVNEVILLDNFDGFFDRRNEVQVLAVTVDSNQADPIRFSTLSSFVGIKKHQRLPIGDGGLMMYQSSPKSFPKFLHLNLLLVEDDSDTRDLGKTIGRVRETSEYKDILSAAQGLAGAANPAYSLALDIGNATIGLVSALLEQNSDDIIAYFTGTYSLAFDNLGVGKHTFHAPERARVQYEILART